MNDGVRGFICGLAFGVALVAVGLAVWPLVCR